MRIAFIFLSVFFAIAPPAVLSVNLWKGVREDTVSLLRAEARTLSNVITNIGDVPLLLREVRERLAEDLDRELFFAIKLKEHGWRAGSPSASVENQLEALAPGELGVVDMDGRRILIIRADIVEPLDGRRFGDVALYVGRRLPAAHETRAHKAMVVGWVGYILVLTLLVAGYVWFDNRYVLRLKRINKRLTAIGAGRLEDMPVPAGPQEVRALAEHVNLMVDGLRSLLSGLRSLTDVAAHELRTPLTRMKFKLLDLSAEIGPGKEKEIALLENDLNKVLNLFDGLLELAQARADLSNQNSFEAFDLSGCLEEIAVDYEDDFERGGFQFARRIAGELCVIGEGTLIRQIFDNLLSNALKYAPPCAEISLTLHRTGERFEAAVANTGGGFPEDIRDKAFVTGERSIFVEHIAGLGLGLNLVRAIAVKHGWRVWIEPSDEKAEIRVSGPAYTADHGPACED